ncbi:hypothetical protein [Niallia sp. 01092]|uniref:hypothetical protein n=1 Tax=unclassified Niallia TaxID=2837522 RepID=UPI003FD5FF7A
MESNVNRSVISTMLMFLLFASMLFYLIIFVLQEISIIKENGSLYEFHTVKNETALNNMDISEN